jgi:hypothetical protein
VTVAAVPSALEVAVIFGTKTPIPVLTLKVVVVADIVADVLGAEGLVF